jgi:hypothetical protein
MINEDMEGNHRIGAKQATGIVALGDGLVEGGVGRGDVDGGQVGILHTRHAVRPRDRPRHR